MDKTERKRIAVMMVPKLDPRIDVFNLGSGIEYSAVEIVEALAAISYMV